MKIRTTALAAASIVAGLVMSGCSSSSSSTSASSTSASMAASGSTASSASPSEEEPSGDVTLWMYPVISDATASKQFWDKIQGDFEASHKNINLKIQLQTFDKRDAQISAALAAGKGPDLVMITPDQISTYLGVDGLLPVDDAVSDDRDKFYPSGLDVATYNNHLYGVPLFQNAVTTVYDKKIFDDAGLPLPATWNDLLADAPTLAKKGVAVLDYWGNPSETLNNSFYPLLWQAGGTVFTKDGKGVAFDSDAGVSALQFLLDLKAAGGLPPNAATQTSTVDDSAFAAGKVAVREDASLAQLAQMRAALGNDNVVLGPPLTGKKQVIFANPGMLALTSINKTSNRDAAYEVIRYLTSPTVQAELNKAAGNFPTRTDVAAPGNDPDTQALANALKFATSGEPNKYSRQVMAILSPYIQSALKGDLTAAQALSRAAKDARSVIARG